MSALSDALRPFRRQGLAIALIAVAGILGGLSSGLHRTGGRMVDAVRDSVCAPPAPAAPSVLFVGMSAAEARDPGAWLDLILALSQAGARALVLDATWDQPDWGSSVMTQRLDQVFTACATRPSSPLPVILGLRPLPTAPDRLPIHWLAPLHTNVSKVVSKHAGWVALGVSDPGGTGDARRPRAVDAVGSYRVAPVGAVVASMLEGRTWRKGERRLRWYPDLGAVPRAEWVHAGPGGPALQVSGNDALPLVRDRVVFVSVIAEGTGTAATTGFSRMEGHATLFLNLMRREGAAPYPRALGVLLALASAIVAGWWFPCWSPGRAAWMAAGWLGVAFVAGLTLVATRGLDSPWFSVWGPQALVAAGVAWLPLKSVFLSYRRSDGGSVVQAIAPGLRTLGVEVFLESERHDSGRLEGFLAAALRSQGNLAVILTPEVIHRWNPVRDWIKFELGVAREAGRPRIPVFVDDFEQVWRTVRQAGTPVLDPDLIDLVENHVRCTYRTDQPKLYLRPLARRLVASRRRAVPRRPAKHGDGTVVAGTPTDGTSSAVS